MWLAETALSLADGTKLLLEAAKAPAGAAASAVAARTAIKESDRIAVIIVSVRLYLDKHGKTAIDAPKQASPAHRSVRYRVTELMTLLRAPHSLRGGLLAVLAVFAVTSLAPAANASVIKRERWLTGVTITEYFPVPEAWFVGKRVRTPGVARKSKVDWLYSARGLAMEGDGIGTNGKRYHIENSSGSWITSRGKSASFGVGGVFAPFWLSKGYWKTSSGRVTFPLETGGWANGTGRRYVASGSVSFGSGPSRDLSFYRSVAVDPGLIPLGSLVYVSAYKSKKKDGWFRADDTGGAIDGRHIDVYRPPPSRSSDSGNYFSGRKIFVVPKNRVSAYLKSH